MATLYDQLQWRVARLEERLLWAIVALAPKELNSTLTGYLSCTAIEETHGWQDEVICDVIRFACTNAAVAHGMDLIAPCPLCRFKGATSSGGFVVPEGLRRHLWGHGAKRCVVMDGLMCLAYEYWRKNLEQAPRRAKSRAHRKH